MNWIERLFPRRYLTALQNLMLTEWLLTEMSVQSCGFKNADAKADLLKKTDEGLDEAMKRLRKLNAATKP